MRLRTRRSFLLMIAALLWALVAFAEPSVAPTIAPTATPSPTPAPTPTPTPLPVYEDALVVEQRATPGAMVVPEPMQVKLTLTNPGGEVIGDVRVCRDNGSLVAELGTLAPGADEALTFSEPITPTNTQLDENQITYIIRYTPGYAKPGAVEKERLVPVPIEKLPAEPGVDFTRTIPVTSLKPSEEVAIAYRVRNTGNVALTDISIADGKLGVVATLERLDPGERKTFIHRFEMDETFVSKPVMTYSHRATREVFEKELAGTTIYLADELLEVTLEADKSTVSPGDAVTLTYRVVNRGGVSYDHLHLSDQGLGDLIALPSDLRPGKDYVFTKTVVLKSTTTFLFTLTGKSEGGSQLEATSNPLTVAVTPVKSDVLLTLKASASITRLSGPSDVDFALTITNDGNLDIRNVRLLEQERGEIKTLAVVAQGETVAEVRYPVDEPGQFKFMAKVTDAQGGDLTVLSNAVEIEFAPDGTPAVTASKSEDALRNVTGSPQQLPDEPLTFVRMMIGVVVVLVVLGTLMAAASVSRRRKKRRARNKQLRMLRRNYRRERQEDERQSTRPHSAVKRDKPPPASDSRRPGSLGQKRKEGK